MQEEALKATGERIFSYSRGEIEKKLYLSDIAFKDIFYIPTLVYNLYSMSCLRRRGRHSNMKLSGEITFTINQKIIGYAYKVQK